MQSFRFLLSRRWALFAVVVVAVAWATWWLGSWQFDRLDERRESNRVVERNEDLQPAPVADVLAPGEPVAEHEEWRVVEATGRYDTDATVVIRYQTREGQSGVDVVVPLVTADGTALVVDRGWMPSDNRGADATEVPAPPAGEVTVTGWVRADGTGESTRVVDGSARAISSEAIAEAQGREVYGGFVDLRSEDPPPAEPLAQAELPEQDDGPHFFYGLQWWFFGLLAIAGFVYLAWDERRGGGPRGARRPPRPRADPRTGRRPPRPGQSARSNPPSTGSIAPDTNDAAGESRKAAARPNSSGRP